MRQVGGGGHTVGVISSGTEYFSGQMVMYIVLEYVHGCTLSQLLRVRNALSLGEALDILIPVVDGALGGSQRTATCTAISSRAIFFSTLTAR